MGVVAIWLTSNGAKDSIRNLINDDEVVTKNEAVSNVKEDLARTLNIQPDTISVENIRETTVTDLNPEADFPDCPDNALCVGPTTEGYMVLLSAGDTFYTYMANKYYEPGIEKRGDSLPRTAVSAAKGHLAKHLNIRESAIHASGGSFTAAVFIDCPSLEDCKLEDGYAVNLIYQDTEYYYKLSKDLNRIELGDSYPK